MMTTLTDLLSPERILFLPRVESKKQALEHVSQLFTHESDAVDVQQLFESFTTRERLGSTGIGHGVAIPHVRSELVQYPMATLLYIKEGVAFDAIDRAPVDIIVGLIVPIAASNTHLEILAQLAKQFSQTLWLHQLRSCQSTAALQGLLLIPYERTA